MSYFDAETFARNVHTIGKALKHLNETILFGWPFKDHDPTEEQAYAIVSTFQELSLQDPTCRLHESRRWYLAGQIIARIERDTRER